MPETDLALIEQRIYTIRGVRVILDSDLAALYGVPTKRLNEQYRRNRKRFPEDFAFQLTVKEANSLRSQIATSSSHGGRRYRPYAFTEHGILMLSSVLNSERAISVNIEIMRAFVRLRQVLDSNLKMAARLYELERRCDERFSIVFTARSSGHWPQVFVLAVIDTKASRIGARPNRICPTAPRLDDLSTRQCR